MSRYRVGVIGLSWITTDPAHVGSAPVLGLAPPHTHLSALASLPNVTVVAGCDIVPEACARFVETWEGTWPGLKTYADYAEMLEREQLDVVCVATPDQLRGDAVRLACACRCGRDLLREADHHQSRRRRCDDCRDRAARRGGEREQHPPLEPALRGGAGGDPRRCDRRAEPGLDSLRGRAGDALAQPRALPRPRHLPRGGQPELGDGRAGAGTRQNTGPPTGATADARRSWSRG